jgi:tRNA G18 (ribose-2'-O)-methylase SpoU
VLDDDKSYMLILGEERYGLTPELLKLCDATIEIPMVGMKESFNVSVAAGMAMWELLKPASGL